MGIRRTTANHRTIHGNRHPQKTSPDRVTITVY
jgi:hypothetical protein